MKISLALLTFVFGKRKEKFSRKRRFEDQSVPWANSPKQIKVILMFWFYVRDYYFVNPQAVERDFEMRSAILIFFEKKFFSHMKELDK